MIKFKSAFELQEIFETRYTPFVPNKDLRQDVFFLVNISRATPLLL
jgi:hypothetical protein